MLTIANMNQYPSLVGGIYNKIIIRCITNKAIRSVYFIVIDSNKKA